MSYDAELIDGFIEETNEVLEEVEPTLIELSQKSSGTPTPDKETINSIFRLFHSMKSSAAFLGFSNIAKITHVAENLIQSIREEELFLTEHIASTLCKTTDLITEILVKIRNDRDDSGFEDRIAQTTALLSQHLEEGKAAPQPKVEEEEAPPSTPTAQAGTISETDDDESTQELLSPDMYNAFISEANEQLDMIEQCFLELESEGFSRAVVDTAYRTMHSFKGNCSFMNFNDLEDYSHLVETILSGVRENKVDITPDTVSFLLEAIDLLRNTVGNISQDHTRTSIENLTTYTELMRDVFSQCFPKEPPAAAAHEQKTEVVKLSPSSNTPEIDPTPQPKTSPVSEDSPGQEKKESSSSKNLTGLKRNMRNDIRVKLEKLDHIINLSGELVIAESMVTRNPALGTIEDEIFSRSIHQLRRICSELQDASMALRMVPLSSTFKKMIRVVHDLSQKIDKKIKLEIIGEDTEVDKTVIELIGDPLVHIIRNSCDHGIESRQERLQNGKSELGNIRIEGRHEGGEVWIIVSDDGRGLNRDKIIQKAIENNLLKEKEIPALSDEEIYRLIFHPGFSTAESISDVSGRGVGMDVVKKNIEKMNGEIDIQSVSGQGSSFIIRIPLTLAIIDGMLIKVGPHQYTLPTLSIKRSITCTEEMLSTSPEGAEILNLDNTFLPVLKLGEILQQETAVTNTTEGILVIVDQGGKEIALLADEIIGQQQTVIKGLSDYLGKARGASGCTILGDGSVSLILDIRSLIEIADEMLSLQETTTG
ncbi:chemotaxis protein CheW [Chitinivibrio alkaliphilus]|uniref:Chemotaxis protein CheA n=1 Tax=Chitinivibrio alkaliphilus ACht1 TaxID=1313304 RepID=U7D889_9BACT|nr:chemotaxis protein CheA [Chitinivibrio alkaliphilus]ERP32158.1 CheA signal transduction histidine kinase [Chitinivibrio alkaliphilus ACht1]